MNEAQRVKGRLGRIFKRKGRDGRYTRLFENLNPLQREALLKETPPDPEELPVIGSAEGQEKWMLITTKRIVWRLNSKTQSLPLEAIWDVVADFPKLVTTGLKKDEMKELQILTADGRRYSFEVEKGAPLSGVWNALKNVGHRNRGLAQSEPSSESRRT
jgi:hypothetical protein